MVVVEAVDKVVVGVVEVVEVVLAVVLGVAVGLLLLEPGCQQTLHRNTLYIHFLHKYLDKKNRMPAPEHG
jgi:hypothetical protein